MKKACLFLVILSQFLIGCTQTVTTKTAIFSSDFEDQTLSPEIGKVSEEYGTSGEMKVVPNPHFDTRNNSEYVLKVATKPGTGGRAEYSAWRYETNEKKYIYTWKRYHAPDMFKDIKIQWASTNQWKTWPCEYYGKGKYNFSDEICYSGGIFNDMHLEESDIGFRTRAYPDCNIDHAVIPEGYWVEFVLEIYWTSTRNGYYRIWINDDLFGYGNGVKTLMDGFIEGSCDIYWSNGLYTYWEKTGGKSQDELIAYIDDIAIYDVDNGITIDNICPNCETVPTDTNSYKKNLSEQLFPNPVKDILFINLDSIPNNVTVYTSDGTKVESWDNKTEIDVSALPAGIYIASIKLEKSTVNGKFIKY